MRTFSLVLGICFLGVALTSTTHAQTKEQQLSKAYDQLKANTLKAMDSGKFEQKSVNFKGTKLRLVGDCEIDPVVIPAITPAPICMGVKIWGQIVNPDGSLGPLVNLTKHKWQKKEQFYLWLDAAVPLQLAVFQNYTDGRPKSKQVSPDEKFPRSFETVVPGTAWKFPVRMEMDDDLIDEQVSIVVVRADTQCLPVNGAPATVTATATATATAIINSNGASAEAGSSSLASVSGPGGTLKGSLAKSTRSVFKQINDQLLAKPATKNASHKLRLVAAPPAQAPAESQVQQDVEILMMGAGNIAQIELTFHKD